MITLVAGARPNFVKLAPIVRELQRREVPFRWIHTGQHKGALDIWQELDLPSPNVHIVAAGTHANMTAEVMVGVEANLIANRPDWLVVLGDVNSTLGAALAAVKLGVKIAHVEAGYRSHDWSMPEEVNRVLVDTMSDLLLTPDRDVHGREWSGRRGARRVLVGNVMMDSLRWAMTQIEPELGVGRPKIAHRQPYAVLTVHRPSNVDHGRPVESFARIHRALAAAKMPIVWPVHPRSAHLHNEHLSLDEINVTRIDPLGYLDMVALLRDASLVITDSGGVYEEALYLGKEIVSLRDPDKNERAHLTSVPEIWKTDAAPRIVEALLEGAR